jgi:subtilisin family serine protease
MRSAATFLRVSVLTASLFLAAGSLGFCASEEAEPELSPSGMTRVPGQYIVVLRDNAVSAKGAAAEAAVGRAAAEIAGRVGGQVGHLYSSALRGFVVKLPRGAGADRLRDDPRVQFIQEDGVAYAFDHVASEIPTGVNRVNAELNPTTVPGGSATLGIAVIDTGIQLNHPDLNVLGSVSFVRGKKNGNDDNGHGTHVAGTIGAKDNGTGVVGIAPGAPLYAVKVLNRNGSGFWSDVIKGVDWVTANAGKIAAANMSLGGGGSDDGNCGNTNGDALHKAICNSTAAGVVYVVAAGNSSADAKNSVPAAYDEVFTVSALADSDGQPNGTGPATSYGADDTFATFSNFGADVDVIAPGVSIRSTYLNGGYATGSGTSMACPHVTGGVALWVAQNGRPVTGNAKDPAVRAILAQISESVGFFQGDPDGVAEPMENADTAAAGGSGSSVCCPAP